VKVTPSSAGWTYSGLAVRTLAPDETHTLSRGKAETLVLPLSGGCTVSTEGTTFEVAGRESVFLAKTDTPVELRGAGRCSRQVNNFCTPAVFEADKLIACEVLTPGGNWSSYPPHKHDETREGECELEENYYFEAGGDGMAGPGETREWLTSALPI
jgi:5-deoxy-glucuronate isomerase